MCLNKMNFTYKNHLRYYIGQELYGFRSTPYQPFKVEVGKIDRELYKNSNWVEEQYRTAKLIASDFGKDLVVMFSGGTDSEIVLRAFKAIKINPRVVFVRFDHGFNEQDYIEATKTTQELNLSLEVIDFDIVNFCNSGEALEFADEIQCRQLAYLCVYYNIKKLQLPAIMGGEMLLQKQTHSNGSSWYYCFRENQDGSAIRFSLKYNIPLVNEWFSYTPEMMAYYLENPMVKQLVTDKFNFKTSSISSKNNILKQYMPELRNKTKTHGYEKLMGLNQETYYDYYTGNMYRLENSLDGIYIDELKKQLY